MSSRWGGSTPLFFSFPTGWRPICGRSAQYARRESAVQADFALFTVEFSAVCNGVDSVRPDRPPLAETERRDAMRRRICGRGRLTRRPQLRFGEPGRDLRRGERHVGRATSKLRFRRQATAVRRWLEEIRLDPGRIARTRRCCVWTEQRRQRDSDIQWSTARDERPHGVWHSVKRRHLPLNLRAQLE